MQKTRYILLATLLLLIVIPAISQNESKLAYEYYQNSEFAKAAELYQKLHKQNPNRSYYSFYIKCLIELKEYKDAEKVVKKQYRASGQEPVYLVDWGFVLAEQGNNQQAQEKYKQALQQMPANKMSILQIANAFASIRQYDWAENTYLQGRKMVMDDFRYEMANLFAIQRKHEKMVNEYLTLLDEDFSAAETVKARLQYYVSNDFDDEFANILKNSLLRKIQQSPDNYLHSEMLIWFYLQKKQFAQALIQAKSLDMRFNENGKRVLDLAHIAFTNQQTDKAYEAYQYVEAKGDQYRYYFDAIAGKLAVLYYKVTHGLINTQSEIALIEQQYNLAIEAFSSRGLIKNNFQLYQDLAHLQAFYLNKPLVAIDLLKHAANTKGIPPVLTGKALIEMADIYLLMNDEALATLTYAKAEGMNKNNETGDWAKFKKAKLAFYTGDFEWAEAQLDVLKASTSKLIANDAFELSQLIKQNYTDSSLLAPLQAFANAELLSLQNKNKLAIEKFDSLFNANSAPLLADDILFKKAEIFRKQGKFKQANELYRQIYTNYSFDLLADNALFWHAKITDYQLNNKQQAMELYKQIMVTFKGSVFVVEARTRFRELRGE